MTGAPGSAVIVGTGLIGTSVALALRARGTEVWLSDADPAAARLAADLGAGRLLPGGPVAGGPVAGGPVAGGAVPGGPADVAVLAVPPAAIARCLAQAQRDGLARCCTDVASVKELPLREAAELGCDLTTFVPGHPMAGRERSGPAAARSDLFAGQPWVICPGTLTSRAAVEAVTGLAVACGARPIRLSAAEHDRWVALVSHLPHLVSSAMAALCADAPEGALALAGPGLRDVTRIAAGDSGLWTGILAANAGPVRAALQRMTGQLAQAVDALAGLDAGHGAAGLGAPGKDAPGRDAAVKQLTALLDAGREGVERIPGKRGGPAPHYAVVQVVIGDRPGELARLFAAAGSAGINIEDVRIEHSPGLPAGVAELSVRPEVARRLSAALADGGWPVASPA